MPSFYDATVFFLFFVCLCACPASWVRSTDLCLEKSFRSPILKYTHPISSFTPAYVSSGKSAAKSCLPFVRHDLFPRFQFASPHASLPQGCLSCCQCIAPTRQYAASRTRTAARASNGSAPGRRRRYAHRCQHNLVDCQPILPLWTNVILCPDGLLINNCFRAVEVLSVVWVDISYPRGEKHARRPLPRTSPRSEPERLHHRKCGYHAPLARCSGRRV